MPTAPSPENGFAAVLARAIRDSRLSLPQIQTQLKRQGVDLDLATLTYWRSGSALPAQEPDLVAVAALEDLLGLGVGQLSLRLPDDAISRWDPVRRASAAEQLKQTLSVLGLHLENRHDYAFVQDTLWVSEDRMEQREHTRQLVRAIRDGVDSVPIAMRQRFLGDEPPLITVGHGCELRDVVRLEEEAILCAEIRLSRPLAKGELHMFDYTMDWRFSERQDDYGFTRVVRGDMRYWALVAHFPEVPSRVDYSFDFAKETEEGVGFEHEQSQSLQPATTVEVVLRDPLSGMHTVDWDF